MADINDLAQKIAFYQAGGRDPGTDTLDKINTGAGIVDKTITDVLAIKKAKVDNEKTRAETVKLGNENTPYTEQYLTPSIKADLKLAENAPVPVQDLVSGKLNSRQQAIDEASNRALQGQAQYGNLTTGQVATKAAVNLKDTQADYLKNKSAGQTINVDDIISKATGLPIGKITKVQYDATLNALKLQAKTDPNRPLTPYQALVLGVPYGTTAAQAEGVIPRSQTDREKITQFNGAIAVVDQVEKLSQKVNVFEDAYERFTSGGLTAVEAYIQSDPIASQLANQGAYLAQIIRGLGEKGALAEGDVKRGLDAIPKVYPLPDTRVVAENKIKELKALFSGISQGYLNTLTTPIRAGQTFTPFSPEGAPPPPPQSIEEKRAAVRAKLKLP